MQHGTDIPHAAHVVQIFTGANVKAWPGGSILRLLRMMCPSRCAHGGGGSVIYRRTSPGVQLMADVCLSVLSIEVARGVLVCALRRWRARVEAGRELLWRSSRAAWTDASRRFWPIAGCRLHRRHRVDCLALCLSVSLHQWTCQLSCLHRAPAYCDKRRGLQMLAENIRRTARWWELPLNHLWHVQFWRKRSIQNDRCETWQISECIIYSVMMFGCAADLVPGLCRLCNRP